ncbi:viral A-type inclusion protein [Arundinibacter roseus]|uniref:Viral A-type inclusion protein n=1 Tax=Arundinibacter roseus TaxID=2070510 RepID=A0A4R4KIX4_9BACT|nr:viral A-type inclusion protein [Arundinibacter roseus]TDB68204.1 viral A-type inclusion protein [Arundinibacter roseus]
MKLKTGLSSLLIFVAMACNQEAEQVASLEKEVLAIHDEVMPQMTDIMKLKRQLSTKINELDSLQQEGVSSTTFAEQRLKALDLSRNLILADSLMMQWMYTYRGDSAKALPAKDALGYFQSEKEKISEVKLKTDQSVQAAKEFLK